MVKKPHVCYVELDDNDKFVRIYRKFPPPGVRSTTAERCQAVAEIRLRVFERAGGRCEYCNAFINFRTGHMHEKIPKGRGGEVSLENCVAICARCHILRRDSEHGARRPRFNESQFGSDKK